MLAVVESLSAGEVTKTGHPVLSFRQEWVFSGERTIVANPLPGFGVLEGMMEARNAEGFDFVNPHTEN